MALAILGTFSSCFQSNRMTTQILIFLFVYFDGFAYTQLVRNQNLNNTGEVLKPFLIFEKLKQKNLCVRLSLKNLLFLTRTYKRC